MNILSISQYGSGLLSVGALSGALDRQKDYAATLSKYVVLVPGTINIVRHGEALEIRGIPSSGVFSFCFHAYRTAVYLQTEYQFDAVMVDNPHLGGILGLVLKYRLRIPLVVHSMADMIYNPWYTRERFSNHFKHALMLISVFGADVVRVSTQTEIDRLTKKGVPRQKLHRMYFYIDADVFDKRLLESHETKIGTRILFVGRLSYQKDIGTLIRAMTEVAQRHPEAKLVLLGSGELRSEYEMLARTLGVEKEIEFTGAIPYERVAGEFKKATVFALPSLYEGTCMVLHEAGFAQLPIISTDVAGSHDFVRNGIEGCLVPVRDPRAFGKALCEVLDDKEAILRMGMASRVRAASFTRESALLSWQELCNKVKKLQKPSSSV